MAIQDVYKEIGADYDEVLHRLMNESMVERFCGKFLDDTSYADLKTAMENGDVKAAFMAAHTLKGICSNLGFSNLGAPASELTEILRADSFEGAPELFAQVQEQYEKTIAALKSNL